MGQHSTIIHPHDKFFQTVMSDMRVAKDFLTNHLPEALRNAIDFNQLQLQPRSKINDMRKKLIVDVLYKTQLLDKDAFIWILLEHQSKADKLMPFRMLKYTCNIIEEYVNQSKEKRIPLVFPMVVYHGKKSYPYSTDIKDLVNAPKDLVDQYFLKPFHLIDLGQIEDKVLKEHIWAGASEFVMKHIFANDLLVFLKEFADCFHRLVKLGGEDHAYTVLQYSAESGEISDIEGLYKLINTKISPAIGDKVMSLGNRLRAEGRSEGLSEGLFRGILQEKVEIAKRLLLKGMRPENIAEITELSINEIKVLQEKALS